jgi:N-acetylmuramoyl-L-alanine amidase
MEERSLTVAAGHQRGPGVEFVHHVQAWVRVVVDPADATRRAHSDWHPVCVLTVRVPRLTSLATSVLLALAILLALASMPATVPATAPAQDGEDAALRLTVGGSPLLGAGDGPGIKASVRLAEPADVRLWVEDFDGREVRELYAGRRDAGILRRTWQGRDEAGEPVRSGPYLIVALASDAAPASGDERATGLPAASSTWVTVADHAVYPQGPGLITVAVDPGHGGLIGGAVAPDGTREADLNLDIGLRLARMLQGAGIVAILTRRTDAQVNEPPTDRTGDGAIDETDELAARPDLANAVRADLFIAVHNNIAVDDSVGGPSTFYFDERTFGDRSRRLARLIQKEMVTALGGVVSGDWQPFDHGALVYPYYVLRDYDPPRLIRPTLMPGVLSEGLFLSNPRELRLLRKPRVRQAMAVAYYEAIGRYLARRDSHVGYRLIEAADVATAGEPFSLTVEVRNQGTEPLRGWHLVVGALPSDSASVGRAREGASLGRRRLPALAPGESAEVDLEMAAPARGARWMLLVDAEDRSGGRASAAGSPMLTHPMLTIEPLPPSVCCFVLPEPGPAEGP